MIKFKWADKNIETETKSMFTLWIIFAIMIIGIIVLTMHSIHVIEEKNRTINNLQDEVRMLREENADIMGLYTQYMENADKKLDELEGK